MPMRIADQAVTPQLREWIVAQARGGRSHDAILHAMRASGWGEGVVRAALAQLRDATGLAEAPQPHRPSPEPGDMGSRLRLDDREVPCLLSLRQPRLALFGGLLGDDECDALVELARPRLARSRTVAEGRRGGSEVNAARTSDGMFFERGETALIERIEQRIAALLHWPVQRGEGLQVLRYGPGAEYRPHFDYFDPAQPGCAAVLARGGQRLATLIIYLQACEQGGATVFPDAGLQIAPVKGHALFFGYDRPEASTGTLHGGAVVLDGEKWVATKWLRERAVD